MPTSNLYDIETWRKIADVMAIPMFILLIYYLWEQRQQNKQHSEEYNPLLNNFLLFFAFVGLLADSFFTLHLIVSIPLNKEENVSYTVPYRKYRGDSQLEPHWPH